MGTRLFYLPDGTATYAPDNLSQEEVWSKMGFGGAPAAKGGTGFFGSLDAGAGGLISSVGSALKDVSFSRPVRPEDAKNYGLPMEQMQRHSGALQGVDSAIQRTGQFLENRGNEIQKENPLNVESYTDIHNAGDLGTYAGERFLRMVPNFAAAAIGGPLAAGAVSTVQTYGDTRQYQRQNGIDDKGLALGTSLAVGAIDALTGVEGMLGNSPVNLLGRVAEKGFAGRVAAGAVEEGLTEGVQQAIQRVGQHQDLTSADAWHDYIDNALPGAIIGGGFGTLHGRSKSGIPSEQPDDFDYTSPITPNAPTDLITGVPLLTDQRGSNPLYVDGEGQAAPNLGTLDQHNQMLETPSVPDLRSPVWEQSPEGSQGDLFSVFPKTPAEQGTREALMEQQAAQGQEQTDQGGQQETQLPDPLQPSLFDNAPSALTRSGYGPQEITRNLTGGARPDAYTTKLTYQLSRAFADEDVESARKVVDRELDRLTTAKVTPETIDHRQNVLQRAANLVEGYRGALLDAQVQTGVANAKPGVNVGPEPVSSEGTVQQIREQNKDTVPNIRQDALNKTLERVRTKGDLRDPLEYFKAQLKRNGVEPDVSDQEFDAIYSEQEQRVADDARDVADASNNGVAPLEAQIPSARKADVATAANTLDVVKSKVSKAARPSTQTQAAPTDDTPGVTKVAPGDARGLDKPEGRAPAPVKEVVEQAGELTQEQVDQRDTYFLVDQARRKNQITDNEQALLTDMLRKGAPVDVVRQAVNDLAVKRQQNLNQINRAERAGVVSPTTAAQMRNETKPRKAAFPGTAVTDEVSETTAKHTRENDLPAALKDIAKNNPNPIMRLLAQTLVRANVNVPISVLSDEEAVGFDGLLTVSESGSVEMEIAERAVGNPSILLHEAIHAFLSTRIGSLDAGYSAKEWRSLTPDMRGALVELRQSQTAVRDLIRQAPPEVQSQQWAQEILRSRDEFVTYVPTDTQAQEYLSSVTMDGKSTAAPASAWAKLVDLVRRALGLPNSRNMRTALEQVLATQLKVVHLAEVGGQTGIVQSQVKRHGKVQQPIYTGTQTSDRQTGLRATLLETAKEMDAAGTNPKAIKLATGWEKNRLDGKWRYEIADNEATLKVDLKAMAPLKLMSKDPENIHKLEDVLDHPELFEMYPDARNIEFVKQTPFMGFGTLAWFNESANRMGVSENHAKEDPQKVTSTILHELQHWVQAREGFARGGNTQSAAENLTGPRLMREVEAAKTQLWEEFQNLAEEFDGLAKLSESQVRPQLLAAAEAENAAFKAYNELKEKYGVDPYALDREDPVRIHLEETRNEWLELGQRTKELKQQLWGEIAGREIKSWFDLTSAQQDLAIAAQSPNIDKKMETNAKAQDQIGNEVRALENGSVEEVRKIIGKKRGFELYQNIAGEREARDVQARQTWGYNQRRTQPMLMSEPNLNDEDAIVTFQAPGAKPAASMSFPASRPANAPGESAISAPTESETNHIIRDAIGNKPSRFTAAVVLGPKLMELAQRAGITSAPKYQRLTEERAQRAAEIEHHYTELAEQFDRIKDRKLTGRGKGSLNALARRMVFTGKWAFQPSWLRNEKGETLNVEVDPELAALHAALPDDAKAVFNDMFRLPHETLHTKRKAVVDLMEGEHSARIESAEKAFNKAKAAGATKDLLGELSTKLRNARNDRQSDLAQFNRLFNVDLTQPYMPTRRFGDFVVVGRSPEYEAMEQQVNLGLAKQADLEKMKSDPAHYFVDFAESELAANRLKRAVAEQFPGRTEQFTRDESKQVMLSGRDMFGAFGRLRNLIGDTITGEQGQKLDKMVTDLMLSTLATTSSRKAEMLRLKVNAGDIDYMRGAISQGRADAGFIAAIHKNNEINDALSDMRDEAKSPNGERDAEGRGKRQEYVNEILKRHAMTMEPPPANTLVDKALTASSFYLLATSPSFFLQQMLQPAAMSVPWAAAKHGYGKTWAELTTGYKRVADAWAGTRWDQSLNLSQLPDDVKSMATWLAERGRLDIGINKEMGNWRSGSGGAVAETLSDGMQWLRGLTRKQEAINRLSTAVMMYNLELKKGHIERIYDPEAYQSYRKDMAAAHPDMTPMTEREFAAANHALKLVDDTHGNYDIASAPRFMRGGAARVITQFRKFQIMMLQLYGQGINDSLRGETPEKRAIARRGLAYMLGHTALLAGAVGMPGFEMLKWLLESLMGDDDKRFDLERAIRENIKNPTLADLLLHGVPSLAQVNLSGSLGQGGLLNVNSFADSPLADKPSRATDAYNQYVVKLLGPSVALVGNAARGVSFMQDGQYAKGLELMVPKGMAGAMRAVREAAQGETNTKGQVTKSDISPAETAATALSLNPLERTRRGEARRQFLDDGQFFDDKSTQLRREYADADPGDRTAIRQDWMKLQAARVQAGLKRQPMSSLGQALREQRKQKQGAGVVYKRSEAKRVQMLSDLYGLDEESDSGDE